MIRLTGGDGSIGKEEAIGNGNTYRLRPRRPSLPCVVAATASRRGTAGRPPADFRLAASRSACSRSAPATPCCCCYYCYCYSADRYLRKSLLPLVCLAAGRQDRVNSRYKTMIQLSFGCYYSTEIHIKDDYKNGVVSSSVRMTKLLTQEFVDDLFCSDKV